MTKIAYDPIKDQLAKLVRNSPILRRIFYSLLNLLFLRSWYIRRLISLKGEALDASGNWDLLDAGCGFGQYDHFILNKFKNVNITSIDVKSSYLEDNRKFFHNEIAQGRIQFELADLLNVDMDKKFDFIICIDVLEHIEEDQRVIQNLSNLLKKGGYFLMHSPSHLSEGDGEEDDTFVGEHARTGYSKNDIEDKLMIAELMPEITQYTYGKWGRRAWKLSIKWPMILLNKFSLFALIPLLFYYPIILPFVIVMNFADLFNGKKTGNGIYSLAKRI
jgi:SAM-dependent methyltransferase